MHRRILQPAKNPPGSRLLTSNQFEESYQAATAAQASALKEFTSTGYRILNSTNTQGLVERRSVGKSGVTGRRVRPSIRGRGIDTAVTVVVASGKKAGSLGAQRKRRLLNSFLSKTSSKEERVASNSKSRAKMPEVNPSTSRIEIPRNIELFRRVFSVAFGGVLLLASLAICLQGGEALLVGIPLLLLASALITVGIGTRVLIIDPVERTIGNRFQLGGFYSIALGAKESINENDQLTLRREGRTQNKSTATVYVLRLESDDRDAFECWYWGMHHQARQKSQEIAAQLGLLFVDYCLDSVEEFSPTDSSLTFTERLENQSNVDVPEVPDEMHSELSHSDSKTKIRIPQFGFEWRQLLWPGGSIFFGGLFTFGTILMWINGELEPRHGVGLSFCVLAIIYVGSLAMALHDRAFVTEEIEINERHIVISASRRLGSVKAIVNRNEIEDINLAAAPMTGVTISTFDRQHTFGRDLSLAEQKFLRWALRNALLLHTRESRVRADADLSFAGMN